MIPRVQVVGSVVFLATAVYGGLSLSRTQCGDITCSQWEYCSAFDHVCKPCSAICNYTTANYEKHRCEDECQDYIHDTRYIPKAGSLLKLPDSTLTTNNNQQSDSVSAVENLALSHKVDILLAFVIISCCINIILLLIVFIYLYNKRWKNRRKKGNKTNDIALSKVEEPFNGRITKLFDDSCTSIGPSVSMDRRTTMTTLPYSIPDRYTVDQQYTDRYHTDKPRTTESRRPAEDTCPQGCYDNPGLVPSPTRQNSRPYSVNV